MRVVRYTPEMFSRLRTLARPGSGLSHQPFVDHYYCAREESQLRLLLDKGGEAIGCIGIERMPFSYRGECQTIAFASNLIALSPGAGGVLYLSWVKSAPVSMVFGGSPDTHRILQAQNWTYYPGVLMWRANRQFSPHPDESVPRKFAKSVLRTIWRKVDLAAPAARRIPASLEVREEHEYRDELTSLPSAFAFRLAPDVRYLNWRFGLNLSFARYRLFTIADAGRLAGYVILHDKPDEVVIAHADGSNPALLALGIMSSVVAVVRNDTRRRGVLLTSAHSEMQGVFKSFGLRPDSTARLLAMRGPKGVQPFPVDTSTWLVNFDWGDNSLRPPFSN